MDFFVFLNCLVYNIINVIIWIELLILCDNSQKIYFLILILKDVFFYQIPTLSIRILNCTPLINTL